MPFAGAKSAQKTAVDAAGCNPDRGNHRPRFRHRFPPLLQRIRPRADRADGGRRGVYFYAEGEAGTLGRLTFFSLCAI